MTIDELNAELKEANKASYKYEVQINKIESELAECQRKLLISEQKGLNQQDNTDNLKKEKKKLKMLYVAAAAERLELDVVVKDQERKITSNKETLRATMEKLDHSEANIAALQSSYEESVAEVESYRRKMLTLRYDTDCELKLMEEKNMSQKEAMKMLEEKLTQAKNNISAKVEVETNLKSKTLFTDQLCKSLEYEIDVLQKEKSEIRGKSHVLQQQVYYLEEKLQIESNESHALKLMLKDLAYKHETKISNYGDKTSGYQKQIAEIEEDLRSCQMENSNLMKSLHSSENELSEMMKSLSNSKDDLRNKTLLFKRNEEIHQAEKEALQKKLKIQDEDLASYKERFNDKENDSNILFDRLASSQEQVNCLKIRLSESGLKLMESKQHSKELQKIFDSKSNDFEKEILSLRDEISFAEVQMSVLENKNVELVEHIAASNDEINNYRDEVNALENKLSTFQVNCKELGNTLEQTQSKNAYLEEQMVHLQKQKIHLNEELVLLQSQVSELTKKDTLSKIEIENTGRELQTTVKNNEVLTAELEFKLKMTLDRLEATNDILLSLETKNEALEKDLSLSETFTSKVENELNDLRPKYVDTRKHLLAVILYDGAVNQGLQSEINILRDRRDTLEEFTRALKKDNEEKGNNLDAGQRMIESLSKKLKVSEEIFDETKNRLDMQETRSLLLGKENINLSTSLNASEQKVFNLELKVSSLNSCVGKLEMKLKDASEECKVTSKKLMESASRHRIDITNLHSHLRSLDDLVAARDKEIFNANEQNSSLRKEVISMEKEISELTSNVASLEKRTEEAEVSLAESTVKYQTTVSDLKDELSVIVKSQQDTEVAMVESEEKLQNEIEALTRKLNQTEANYEQTKTLLTETKRQHELEVAEINSKVQSIFRGGL